MTGEASRCEKGVGGCGLSWSPNLALSCPGPFVREGSCTPLSHPSLQVPWVWPQSWPLSPGHETNPYYPEPQLLRDTRGL